MDGPSNTYQHPNPTPQAARTNSREAYKMYVDMVNETNTKCNLRGVIKLKVDPARAVPIEEVNTPIPMYIHSFV